MSRYYLLNFSEMAVLLVETHQGSGPQYQGQLHFIVTLLNAPLTPSNPSSLLFIHTIIIKTLHKC